MVMGDGAIREPFYSSAWPRQPFGARRFSSCLLLLELPRRASLRAAMKEQKQKRPIDPAQSDLYLKERLTDATDGPAGSCCDPAAGLVLTVGVR